MKMDDVYKKRFQTKLDTIATVLRDIELPGPKVPIEFWGKIQPELDKKAVAIMFLQGKYCTTDKLVQTIVQHNPRVTPQTIKMERNVITAREKVKNMHPEQLLKDMWLKYEMMKTLAFVFIPTRRGWRLDVSDTNDVKKTIMKLKGLIMATDRNNPKAEMSPEAYLYELYLAEYMMLIADIEVGLVNWNKFRLQAYKVKHINEVRHYVMYTQLARIKQEPYHHTLRWNYKFQYEGSEDKSNKGNKDQSNKPHCTFCFLTNGGNWVT